MVITLYLLIAIFLIITITGWIMMGRNETVMGFFIACGIATIFYFVGRETFLDNEIIARVQSLGYMFNLVYALAVFVWLD
jgi:hypothetical protein